VTIAVVRVGRDTVGIGAEAPRDAAVRREEPARRAGVTPAKSVDV
jgi:sRNA-binding carbon storage regulator CsrA